MAKKKATFEIEAMDITRSFSRKLNMAAHGGKQYETADIFASRTVKDVPVDSQEEVGIELFKMCQEEVDQTIRALDGEALEESEVEDKPVTKKKKNLNLGMKVTQEETEEIQEHVNNLTMAKTSADLKAAVTKIKEGASEMSADQKKYLSAYYTKRKDAIS